MMISTRLHNAFHQIIILIFVICIHSSKAIVNVENSIRNNTVVATYDMAESWIGPSLTYSIMGQVYPISPEDGCSTFESTLPHTHYENNAIALIKRGNCSFLTKVNMAQSYNYSAVIVYNDENDLLIHMGSKPLEHDDVTIPSIFIGRTSGTSLLEYPRKQGFIVIIIPNPSETFLLYVVPILTFLCISLGFVSACSCARSLLSWRMRQRRRLKKSHLKQLPEKRFVQGEDNFDTCAICLEDYQDGDKIRILPCNHAFHSTKCIDPWLLRNRRSCPLCKYIIHFKNDPGAASVDHMINNDGGSSMLGNNFVVNVVPTPPPVASEERPLLHAFSAYGATTSSLHANENPAFTNYVENGDASVSINSHNAATSNTSTFFQDVVHKFIKTFHKLKTPVPADGNNSNHNHNSNDINGDQLLHVESNEAVIDQGHLLVGAVDDMQPLLGAVDEYNDEALLNIYD